MRFRCWVSAEKKHGARSDELIGKSKAIEGEASGADGIETSRDLETGRLG